jgi:hypothetical protein
VEEAFALSEWPISLLLDEVWLRGRRTLVHELERRGLWPERAQYRRYIAQQHALGERLGEQVLLPAVGERDAALLRSEAAFGAANQRVRERLPIVLAFGHELGSVLHAIIGGQPAARYAVAERCAVFNLGVSLFDVVCDACPDLRPRLIEAFDEHLLAGLASGTLGAGDLARTADAEPSVELRVLLKVIAAFFDLARPTAADLTPLEDLLRRAYRAELAASQPDAATRPDALETARSKSMLPFAVIAEVVRGGECLDDDAGALLCRLADDVSRVFWLTDDLVDAVPDFRSSTLNALLLDGAATASDGDDGAPLRRALDHGVLEATAREIGARLADAVGAVAESPSDPESAARLHAALTCYTRDWLQ